jgi:hypothetical protein
MHVAQKACAVLGIDMRRTMGPSELNRGCQGETEKYHIVTGSGKTYSSRVSPLPWGLR